MAGVSLDEMARGHAEAFQDGKGFIARRQGHSSSLYSSVSILSIKTLFCRDWQIGFVSFSVEYERFAQSFSL
jgi:hypothetical protein